SRRRHTRLVSDWSSDVCSSDLLGAGIVCRWSRRKIQIGMGTALLVMASIMLGTQLNLLPGGGELLGLTGVRLALAVAANAVLGRSEGRRVGKGGGCRWGGCERR